MTDPSTGAPMMPAPPAPGSAGPKASTAFFQKAIKWMVDKKGSDLLLKVGRKPTVRVAGELEQVEELAALTPQDLKALA
jgi:Tfp pilus assembly ATPase PilU